MSAGAGPCIECGRPMRPRHVPPADRPGRVRYGGRGRCEACAKRVSRSAAGVHPRVPTARPSSEPVAELCRWLGDRYELVRGDVVEVTAAYYRLRLKGGGEQVFDRAECGLGLRRLDDATAARVRGGLA